MRTWGSQLGGVIVVVGLARLLSPEAFGLVALALVYISVGQVFVDQGLADAIVQRADLEPEHLDGAFWLSVAFGIALTVSGILAAPIIARLMREPRLEPILAVLSLRFILVGLSGTQEGLLRRTLAFRPLAMRQLVATLAGGGAGVGMALGGLGAWSLVGQELVQAATGTVVLWRVADWRPRMRFSTRHVRDLISYSFFRLGSRLAVVGNKGLAEALIGYLLGPIALGFFNVGSRLASAGLRVLTATAQVALPAFARIQAEPERLKRAYYGTARMLGLLAFPIFVALAQLAPLVVPVAFGNQWIPSVPVLQIMAILGLVRTVGALNAAVINAMGRPDWQFGILLVGLIVTAIVVPFAAPHGITWVAVTLLLRTIVLSPLTARAVHRLVRFNPLTYARQMAPPLAASLIMAGIVWSADRALVAEFPQWARLLVLALLASLAYLSLMLLMARNTVQEAVSMLRSSFGARTISQTKPQSDG